jgi:hypothetical protein
MSSQEPPPGWLLSCTGYAVSKRSVAPVGRISQGFRTPGCGPASPLRWWGPVYAGGSERFVNRVVLLRHVAVAVSITNRNVVGS